MPHHDRVTVSGVITDVFAHRFVLETAEGRLLADITPKGAERIRLAPGDRVTISGERRPSEVKADSFTFENGETVAIEGGKPHKAEEDGADPELARRTAEAAGYAVLGSPRRKPRHFEVLARASDGEVRELHVELDGRLRKTKDADPEKWPEHPSQAARPAGNDAGRP